ncbi:MAG: hypothetical protein MK096_07155 [Oleiphilaceae bacterium]|nr:hypothetical protein [Oleiphilaceae bacterium]
MKIFKQSATGKLWFGIAFSILFAGIGYYTTEFTIGSETRVIIEIAETLQSKSELMRTNPDLVAGLLTDSAQLLDKLRMFLRVIVIALLIHLVAFFFNPRYRQKKPLSPDVSKTLLVFLVIALLGLGLAFETDIIHRTGTYLELNKQALFYLSAVDNELKRDFFNSLYQIQHSLAGAYCLSYWMVLLIYILSLALNVYSLWFHRSLEKEVKSNGI